jgi:hypothetical protein
MSHGIARLALTLATLVALAACTSPTSPSGATRSDCNGGVVTGTGTC